MRQVYYPHGESNPGFRTENPTSWATRRWGRGEGRRWQTGWQPVLRRWQSHALVRSLKTLCKVRGAWRLSMPGSGSIFIKRGLMLLGKAGMLLNSTLGPEGSETAMTATKTYSPIKTYMAKAGEREANWWLVDGADKVVGRLASELAMILMGKHRPTYTPHVDTGDYVVLINAEKVVFTGKKWLQKKYTWYTGYTGLRTETAGKRLARHPELIIQEAVRRMLPKNKLAVKMLAKLKIYVGAEHPHQAQTPEPLALATK